jgi:hypothetical protein
MSESLSNFLADLDAEPELLARFAANPEAELAQTGLTPQEQAAILSRDPREVGKALGMSPKGQGAGKKKKKKKKR